MSFDDIGALDAVKNTLHEVGLGWGAVGLAGLGGIGLGLHASARPETNNLR